MTWMRGFSALMAVSALCSATTAYCGIPIQTLSQALSQTISQSINQPRSFIFASFTQDFSKGFDLTMIQPMESTRVVKAEDVSLIIPATQLEPTSNGGLVASQILDHSLSNWFNSEAVRHSDFGRTAHRVEKSMEGDMSFSGPRPDSIKHNLKFAMRAAQTNAMIQYSGLTNAQLTYYLVASKVNFELREQVPTLGTQVVYSQTRGLADAQDRTDMVSLRWAW